MNKLCVLDRTGHSEVAEWSPSNPDQMAIAQQAFDRLKSEGKAAFATRQGVTVGVVDSFEADADEIIFISPFVGG